MTRPIAVTKRACNACGKVRRVHAWQGHEPLCEPCSIAIAFAQRMSARIRAKIHHAWIDR